MTGSTVRLIHAEVIPGLRQIDTASVHCVVTSPPYWGLRNYGIEPSIWGGREFCAHSWGERQRGPRADLLPLGESAAGRIGTTHDQNAVNDGGQFCTLCAAWRGCLGLEPTPELFVAHIVEVFRHVRRVLHPSGTVWLNMGDSYIAQPHGDGPSFDPRYPLGRDRSEGTHANRLPAAASGLKSKDLVMMPARIALALQEDGWYLRQQIPWLKTNGLPESCVDRPASMVEYIFLLSREEQYFYDRAAVMLPQAEHERTRRLRERRNGMEHSYTVRRQDEAHGQVTPGATGALRSAVARQALAQSGVRNRRNTDWWVESVRGLIVGPSGEPLALRVNPQPFTLDLCTACGKIFTRGLFRRLPVWSLATKRPFCECGESQWLSHFATFPEAMVEPCIRAGASELGVCSRCGSPWERIASKPGLGDWNADPSHKLNGVNRNARKGRGSGNIARVIPDGSDSRMNTHRGVGIPWAPGQSKGYDWRPTCSHPLFPQEVVPATVLDPFGGSGTSGVVAKKLGCHAILIDRNENYLRLAAYRVARTQRPVSSVPSPAGSDLIDSAGTLSPAAEGAHA